MTIDESIRYNAVTLNEMERQLLHHRASALQLGIEALKRLQRERDKSPESFWDPLPGETLRESTTDHET